MPDSRDTSGPGSQSVDTPSDARLEQLLGAYRSLRSLFLAAIGCMLILTGSVFLFLLREVSATRSQVSELTQYVAAYEKNSVPVMRQFRDKLIEFAKSNPDFAPILSKYVNPTNYPAASQSSGVLPASEQTPPVRVPVVPTR